MWSGTANDGSLVAKGRHSVAFNGVEITFIGQANQFDEFTYDPVKGSAGGVALAIRRPQGHCGGVKASRKRQSKQQKPGFD